MRVGKTGFLTDRPGPLRIGVFGGSFNPIHNGHMEAINVFKNALHLDAVLLVPSGASFYKQTSPVSFVHRYRMCQLAAQGLSGVSASDVEGRHTAGMYSCDMLEAVKHLHPDATLFLLMGSDVYERVPLWKGLERIAGLATIAVIIRSGIRCHREATENMLQRYRLTTLFVHGGHAQSSTSVRREREQGRSIDAFVPPSVADYIGEQQLYMKKEGALV